MRGLSLWEEQTEMFVVEELKITSGPKWMQREARQSCISLMTNFICSTRYQMLLRAGVAQSV
jgi:hypothetical protein